MPIITPPFRTSLLTANGVPFATDNGDIQTTRDWWLYWNQLTDRSNSNSKLATAGTHGDRPSPDGMPEGALYYENDRGVLYAATLGVWQYVAGTMFGTLSPVDARPTDLGTHDAGFDFRTIVAPAREFLWSQAEWIEVTPVQYGPHSARPNPATIVQGALYVEGDRGGVIYQVESPAGTNLWQYLAGTMWGTLVPDQRPTDLGVHDAGFDFRTTVAPPREFIWNQTAWIETTPGRITTQTQPGRVLGTTYQNTNATPLFAAVSCRLQFVGGFCQIQAFTDAAASPGTIVAQLANFATGPDIAAQLFFVVLPNNYYKVAVAAGTGTLFTWTEWF
jgi:hypothetical protein